MINYIVMLHKEITCDLLCHPSVCVDVKGSHEISGRGAHLKMADLDVGGAIPQLVPILVLAVVGQARHDARSFL